MSSAFGIRSSFGFRKFGFRVNSSPAPDANHGFRESVRGGLERNGPRLTGFGVEITRTILVQALLRDTSNTSVTLCRADIPVCWLAELSSSALGDWKVTRTRSLESLRYTAHDKPTSLSNKFITGS
jgi:hypothetical protein